MVAATIMRGCSGSRQILRVLLAAAMQCCAAYTSLPEVQQLVLDPRPPGLVHAEGIRHLVPNDMPNLIFVKVPKTGSSVVGGIARRIAQKHGLEGCSKSTPNLHKEPIVWANHLSRSGLTATLHSLQGRKVMVTSIRDPLERAMAHFYHMEVSVKGREPSTANKIQWLNSTRHTNFMLKYISPTSFSVPDATNATIRKMLEDSYDLITQSEQLDESAVLLANMLGVPLDDVLYLDAKVSGSFVDPRATGAMTVHPPLSEEPREVIKFAKNEYRRLNKLDYALFDIVKVGVTKIFKHHPDLQKHLAEFKVMRSRAVKECVEPQSGWKPDQCFWHDNGCGYQCLDNFASKMQQAALSVGVTEKGPFPLPVARESKLVDYGESD